MKSLTDAIDASTNEIYDNYPVSSILIAVAVQGENGTDYAYATAGSIAESLGLVPLLEQELKDQLLLGETDDTF